MVYFDSYAFLIMILSAIFAFLSTPTSERNVAANFVCNCFRAEVALSSWFKELKKKLLTRNNPDK